MNINPQRLLLHLEALSNITDPERRFTRRAFTPRYQEGRDWLRQQMQAAGLTVRLDAAANLIGRVEFPKATQTLMLGSHIDTVVGGGRFDGVLGVLAALEVAQTLLEHGLVLPYHLEVVDFLSEEPSDYGASCIGSRGMAGTLSAAMLELNNPSGESLRHAMQRVGAAPELLGAPLRSDIAAYLELHIEQGRVLEHSQHNIGVVRGIVAIERYELRWIGRPDHAGTTPMNLRQDALVAASRFVVALRELVPDGLVATVGQLEVSPGNSNVIPGAVRLVFEARGLDETALSDLVALALQSAAKIAVAETVQLESRLISRAAGLHCAPVLQQAILVACQRCGLSALELVSGAGHDAMQLGKIAPAAMLFVPSVEGRSHTPDELTLESDVINGAAVLLETVRGLMANGL